MNDPLSLAPLWNAFRGLWFFFLIIDVVLFVFLFFVVKKAYDVRPKFHTDWRPKKRVLTLRQSVFRERWDETLKKFYTGSPEAVRITIIEADAVVNDVLKHMGLEGDHLADRLSQLTIEEVPSLAQAWKAHRLRNDIVHHPGFTFTIEEAQQALQDFEVFLAEIGAL